VVVRWSTEAERDLCEIGDFIAHDDPVAAARWIERLQERVRRAGHAPWSGRRVAETQREDVREVLLGNHRIIYRIAEDHLLVLTAIEGHRRLQRLPSLR
jgi:toxin ParE1/3/4